MANGKKHGPNCEYQFSDGEAFFGEFDHDEFKKGTYIAPGGLKY